MQLRDPRVVASGGAHLVLDAAVLVVRAPHVEAVGGHAGRELLHRLAASHAGERRVDARGGQLVPLVGGHDQVDLGAAGDLACALADVEARLGDRRETPPIDHRRIGIQPVLWTRLGDSRLGAGRLDHCGRRGREQPESHLPLPGLERYQKRATSEPELRRMLSAPWRES